MSWIAAATAAAGIGASIYGANKQAKAVKSANAANDERLAQQDQSAWNAYLLSRGINPAGATTGQLPTNAEPVNIKLPIYARAAFTIPGAQKTWRKKGTSVPVGRLTPTAGSVSPGNGNPFVMSPPSTYDPMAGY